MTINKIVYILHNYYPFYNIILYFIGMAYFYNHTHTVIKRWANRKTSLNKKFPWIKLHII